MCIHVKDYVGLTCSEVARFCQKYMAAEITQLQHYHEGRVSDSLVEVFHKMDLMLADERYQLVRTVPVNCVRLTLAKQHQPSTLRADQFAPQWQRH